MFRYSFFPVLLLISSLSIGQDFDWVTQVGGTNFEVGGLIAVDSSGNVYTNTRFSNTTDIYPGPIEQLVSCQGGIDFFITKVNSLGDFVWSFSLGGNGTDRVHGMEVDADENLYVSGVFEGTVDFDPGLGVYNLTSQGTSTNGFVMKLNQNGELVWAYSIGDPIFSSSEGIGLDKYNNLTIIGVFMSTVDFDSGPGISEMTSTGNTDIFIWRIDTDGNFLWAKTIGGSSSSDDVKDFTINYNTGNCYISGDYYPIDFDPNAGSHFLSDDDSVGMYITKLDLNGNFLWVRGLKEAAFSGIMSHDMTTDLNDNVLLTGEFGGTVGFNFSVSSEIIVSNGACDIFVISLNPLGNLNWIKSFGSIACDRGFGIDTDNYGNIYTTGAFLDTVDFDPGLNLHDLSSNGYIDVFILTLDAAGNFAWALNFGGEGPDEGTDVVVDYMGSVYATGYFYSTDSTELVDMDPGVTIFEMCCGNGDVYILKLLQNDLGLLSREFENDLIFYPNPAKANICLQNHFELATVKIYDINGKLVLSTLISTGLNNVSIESLESGFYILHLTNGDELKSINTFIKL